MKERDVKHFTMCKREIHVCCIYDDDDDDDDDERPEKKQPHQKNKRKKEAKPDALIYKLNMMIICIVPFHC